MCVFFIVVCLLVLVVVACGMACGMASCNLVCGMAWRRFWNCTVCRHCINCNWLDESFILKGSPYA